MFYKTSAQKEKAYDFYNSFEGNKVSWPTFYYRVRSGGEENREDMIKIKLKTQYRRRNSTPKGKRAKEMIWYNEQPEPKASKNLFKNRLNSNYSKEDAILLGDAWALAKEKKKEKQPQVSKAYIPQKVFQKPQDDRDFKIEITYPKEVAQVFRKEYQRMIDNIERELTYTEEKTQIVEMNEKLERLYKEKEIFNSYNH